jgi:hypothetical protein
LRQRTSLRTQLAGVCSKLNFILQAKPPVKEVIERDNAKIFKEAEEEPKETLKTNKKSAIQELNSSSEGEELDFDDFTNESD